MKPAANSQSLNTNSRPQTSDFPKSEPDSKEQSWAPDCSCSTPAGRGAGAKLEIGSAEISGKLWSFKFFLFDQLLQCLKPFGYKENITVF